MDNLFQKQKTFFQTGLTKDYSYRVEMLKKLHDAIISYKDQIIEALMKDLNKSETEAIMTEIWVVLNEIRYHLKHLKKWMRPVRAKTSLLLMPGKSYLVNAPLGVNLIISSWNYPFQLTMMPLVGAISAGNTAIIKPSEHSPHTSHVLKEMINNTFKEEYVAVVLGDAETVNRLLDHEFDHIFFTGSTGVGKFIMAKAADHLSKVTLELGGKSPCIIDATADIKAACTRIAFGKGINCGQTCVAPDYLICHEDVYEDVVKELKKSFQKLYGDDAVHNPDYPKIINERHFERINGLLQGQNITFGGQYDAQTMKMEPTLVKVDRIDVPLMKEEIFGPILPVITYENGSDLMAILEENPNPLALYLFSNNRTFINEVLGEYSYGGASVNDTLSHFVNNELPFGGIRQSGSGRYHGHYSFLTFSHTKSIYRKGKWEMMFKYPPYNDSFKKVIRKFLLK